MSYPKSVINRYAMKAERLGIYNFESMEKGLVYFWDKENDEIAILRANSQYIRIPERYLETIIEELTGLYNDIQDLRKMGVTLNALKDEKAEQ